MSRRRKATNSGRDKTEFGASKSYMKRMVRARKRYGKELHARRMLAKRRLRLIVAALAGAVALAVACSL